MTNYFNKLSPEEKKIQLGKCRFMDSSEFSDGVSFLKEKKIVIVGCGAQGLHQGLNMRDSGLDISYALRQSSIDSKRQSFLCLLYTSDAADEGLGVDLGGRRIIK